MRLLKTTAAKGLFFISHFSWRQPIVEGSRNSLNLRNIVRHELVEDSHLQASYLEKAITCEEQEFQTGTD